MALWGGYMENETYLEIKSGKKRRDFSPFRLEKETLDELLSHESLHLLDANTIIKNDSEFKGRYRDSQQREIDVMTLNNLLTDNDTFMTGASLSETISIISKANPDLYEKLKDRLNGTTNKKVVNQFDKRLGNSSKSYTEFNNVLDVLESAYGNPTLMRKEDKSRLYDEAVDEYISSVSEEEKDESIFKYFMAFTLDIAGNVDQGDKPNKHNILFDAYNVAMGLTFAHKSIERGKSQAVYITSSDGDVESILTEIGDALCDNYSCRPYDLKKEVESSQEKELIEYLNESIMSVVPENKIEYNRSKKKR